MRHVLSAIASAKAGLPHKYYKQRREKREERGEVSPSARRARSGQDVIENAER